MRSWDLNRLRVWRAVVTAGSVVEAAANLGFRPATVSQHIATLQRSTGLELYRRAGRGIEITDAGRKLAEEAAKVLDQVRRLDGTVDDMTSSPDPRITLSGFTSFHETLLPPVVDSVVTTFSTIRFEILDNERDSAPSPRLPDIEIRSEAGFAPAAEVPGTIRTPLFDDEFHLVVPTSHRLAGAGEVPLVEIAEERWIDAESRATAGMSAIHHACAAAGISPRVIARSEGHYAALALVAAGHGITLLPALALEGLPVGLTSVALTHPVPSRRVCMHVVEQSAHLPHISFTADEIIAQAEGFGFV